MLELGTFYPQKFNFVEKQAKVKQKVQWVYIHKEHFNIAWRIKEDFTEQAAFHWDMHRN